jgi:hypothetical protein
MLRARSSIRSATRSVGSWPRSHRPERHKTVPIDRHSTRSGIASSSGSESVTCRHPAFPVRAVQRARLAERRDRVLDAEVGTRDLEVQHRADLSRFRVDEHVGGGEVTVHDLRRQLRADLAVPPPHDPPRTVPQRLGVHSGHLEPSAQVRHVGHRRMDLQRVGPPPVVRGVLGRGVTERHAQLAKRRAEPGEHGEIGQVRPHPRQPPAQRRRPGLRLDHGAAIESRDRFWDREWQPGLA